MAPTRAGLGLGEDLAIAVEEAAAAVGCALKGGGAQVVAALELLEAEGAKAAQLPAGLVEEESGKEEGEENGQAEAVQPPAARPATTKRAEKRGEEGEEDEVG